MPVISMFYGIIIQMYYQDNIRHHLPHIHVFYQDDEAIFDINTGEIIEGKLPNNKRKLVEAWIEMRKEDLQADWTLAIAGQPVFRIEPLK
jgi:hypothetical protein